jgi:dCMP deaminase
MYLPVVHTGYERFLDRNANADEILLLGNGFRLKYPNMAKDIRALPPQRAAEYIQLVRRFSSVKVVEPERLQQSVTGDVLVMPDEEITRDLAAAYKLGDGRSLVFEPTFLRWDPAWATAKAPISADTEVSVAELPREMLGLAQRVSERSSDWWRQVGAVAARDSKVLAFAWNHHYPSEYSPYFDGDPRDAFERGVRADLSTAIHAEAALIAGAARQGIMLDSADIYTTTFPCPRCARLIAEAGFSRCFFEGQYSELGGEDVLRAANIRIIWVNTEDTEVRRASV